MPAGAEITWGIPLRGQDKMQASMMRASACACECVCVRACVQASDADKI